ncbi:MAG: TlpA disulfide reductase family protein [Nannocystaceae bacterium]
MPKSDATTPKSSKQSPTVMARYLVLVAVFVPVLCIAVYFVGMLKTAEAREVTAACGSLVPAGESKTIKSFPTTAADFTLERLDIGAYDAHVQERKAPNDYKGETVSLADYRGRVVLVNFWASWCKTCRAEKPSLEAMADDLSDEDVAVLALASDPSWDLVRGALPTDSSLTVLLDPAAPGKFGDVAKRYGIKAVPETFVVDKTGVIRYYLINKRDWRSSVAKTCIEALTRE